MIEFLCSLQDEYWEQKCEVTIYLIWRSNLIMFLIFNIYLKSFCKLKKKCNQYKALSERQNIPKGTYKLTSRKR